MDEDRVERSKSKELKNALGYLDDSLGSPDTMNKYRIFKYVQDFLFHYLLS